MSTMQNNYAAEWKEWDAESILKGKMNFGIMILNQPINEQGQRFLENMWKIASFCVAVDGGATHLYKLSTDLIPHLITGDFDSIDKKILTFYEGKGSCIIHTPDQDATDFTKSLNETFKVLKKRNIKINGILVFGSSGGRMDHVMGNIQTLFLVKKSSTIPVYLLTDNSLTWLLEKGMHRIKIYPEAKANKLTVGLIPIGHSCTLTTTGLKWNLDGNEMQFGGLISTSNTYDENVDIQFVTVHTKDPVLWTMEVLLPSKKSIENSANKI